MKASRFAGLLSLALMVSAGRAEAAELRSSPAAVEEPYANGQRFSLATALGNGLTVVSVSGRKHDESQLIRGAFELGYAHPLSGSRWGIHVLGRLQDLHTDFTESHGESRAAVDVGVGPELRLQTRARRPNLQWRLALPLGFTHAWFGAANGRAVGEGYTDGNGFQMSAIVGVDVSGLHSGGFLELEYVLHVFGSTRTAVSRQPPLVTAREDFEFLDHTLFLVTGFLFRP